jgi:hypothetical protein
MAPPVTHATAPHAQDRPSQLEAVSCLPDHSATKGVLAFLAGVSFLAGVLMMYYFDIKVYY